jgi:hypothetical protein
MHRKKSDVFARAICDEEARAQHAEEGRDTLDPNQNTRQWQTACNIATKREWHFHTQADKSTTTANTCHSSTPMTGDECAGYSGVMSTATNNFLI